MMLDERQVRTFQDHIFAWWRDNRRDLPWRKTKDPYHILVSEIMLQQTQVSRVLSKYNQFIAVFPSLHKLAIAKTSEVIRLWKGLGYNRRAVFLKKTAEIIVNHYDGIIPEDEVRLRELPGLGTYTVRALLVFVFHKNTYCVDTNIRKVIVHYFFQNQNPNESDIEDIARRIVPRGQSWEWHQALMDYGALAIPIRSKSKKGSKQTAPFRQTKRYFRGRIVDMLRDKPSSEAEIYSVLMKPSGKSSVFFSVILGELIRDGLITRSDNGIISLPK